MFSLSGDQGDVLVAFRSTKLDKMRLASQSLMKIDVFHDVFSLAQIDLTSSLVRSDNFQNYMSLFV